MHRSSALCRVLALLGGAGFVLTFASAARAQTTPDNAAATAAPATTAAEPTPAPEAPVATPSPAPAAPKDDFWTRKYLTGDWGGARKELQDAGVNYSFLIGTMSQINFLGGLNTENAHETGGRGFHILELDLEKMGLVPGGSFFIRALQTFNSGIQGDVGSLTPPYYALGSSGDQEILLDKYWYRQRLFDDRLEFRLGKLLNFTDLFDKNAYADNYMNSFMNRALNHNQTMPSTLGLGAFVKVWPTNWLYAQAAAIDPEVDADYNRRGTGGWHSAFHDSGHFRGYWEVGVLPEHLFAQSLPGKYAVGWWYDGNTKTVFRNTLGGLLAPRTRNDDVGFFINLEQLVYKENADPKDKQGLGLFARYGFAHEEVNRIGDFWSLGAVYTGLIRERNKDALGFGVAQSILSDAYRREVNPQADRETVYELYYAYEVTPWLTITPDIQVITNPGGNNDARDAFVGGVRLKLVF